MKIKILGSAAGGGFPQWNCNCPNCAGLRAGTIKAQARTQSSIAVSTNDQDWLLINASPDLLKQIRDNPELQPARKVRDTGIAAVLLTDAQIDHVTGLLMLREFARPWPLYTSAAVWEDISTGFPITSILSHYCGVEHHELSLTGQAITGLDFLHDVRITAVPLSSKAPPYSPNRDRPQLGDNIGLWIENLASEQCLFYAPGLGEPQEHVSHYMRRADVVLVDGTLWAEDEMIQLGLSAKKSSQMGHLALSGAGGMIELLDSLNHQGHVPRKVLVHINNSNPILREDSAERAVLTQHGIQVGYDGMEFEV